MSFLVVILVTAGVYFYVRSTRVARQNWLRKLDLPGRWQLQSDAADEGELILNGGLDKGDYTRLFAGKREQGRWQLNGHTLTFEGGAKSQSFDLHFFKTGQIGLEDPNGIRRIYSKQATNIIPLRSGSEPR